MGNSIGSGLGGNIVSVSFINQPFPNGGGLQGTTEQPTTTSSTTEQPTTTILCEPVSVNGYFPLYTSEQCAIQEGNGTFHSHNLNGTLYFMPNGVEYWHGNYSTTTTSTTGEPTTSTSSTTEEPTTSTSTTLEPEYLNQDGFAGFRVNQFFNRDGELWSLGSNADNTFAELGFGFGVNPSDQGEASQTLMTDVEFIAGGGNRLYVIKDDGSVWAVGRNSNGELGDGTQETAFDFIKIFDGEDKNYVTTTSTTSTSTTEEPTTSSTTSTTEEPTTSTTSSTTSTTTIDPSTLWDPSQIISSIWLDASDTSTITHDANLISQWSDKSGNDNHATQSSNGSKPILNASDPDGKVIIDFDGINDSLLAPTLNINQSYSIYLVAKSNKTSSGTPHDRDRDYLFDGIGPGQERTLIALNRSGKVDMYAYNSWANSSINTPTGYFVISAVCNTSSSSLALNGTNVTGLTIGASSFTNGLTIGANMSSTSDFLDGSIAEFLIIDETSSTSTRQRVEGYLAHKWGISSQLPTSHPFKNDIPRVGSTTTSSTTEEPIPTLDKDYIYTSTFGTDTATYSIDESGKISVSGGQNQTANLFYEDPIFSVGDVVSVRITDAPPTDTYLSISTTNRAPNTPGESGIRLRWNSSGTFTSRNYINGTSTNKDFDSSFSAFDQVTLYIKRESNTTFSASFDLGSGKVNFNDSGGDEKQILTITGLSSDPLFIGLETYHLGSREFIDFGTENLGKIIPSTSV